MVKTKWIMFVCLMMLSIFILPAPGISNDTNTGSSADESLKAEIEQEVSQLASNLEDLPDPYIYFKPDTTGTETFEPDETKTIDHHIYWDQCAVSGYFVMGYVRTNFDPAIIDQSQITVQPGLFSAAIVSSGPGYIVTSHWYFFWGEEPINDPEVIAFSISFTAKPDGGTTNLTYDITDSIGNHRGYFLTGRAHDIRRSPVRVAMDTTPPVITIVSPYSGTTYDWCNIFVVNYTATDPESGIQEVSAKIDGTAVENGAQVQTKNLGYGNHIMMVTAVNNAGLESTEYVTFKVIVSNDAVTGIMNSYVTDGLISQGVAQSLEAKLKTAGNLAINGDTNGTTGKLNAFINEIDAQTGKHIDPSTIPFLFQLAKNNAANAAPPVADLPQTLPYLFKNGSYTKITLSCLTQTIEIPLTGEATIEFKESNPNGNIIEFTVIDSPQQTVSFQIDGNDIIYTAWQDPTIPTAGTIDLNTGLVTKHIANQFSLTINGQPSGPYSYEMDLMGIQRWPDIYTSSMYISGQTTILGDVPFFAHAVIETSVTTKQEMLKSFTVIANQVSPHQWNINCIAEITRCAFNQRIPVRFNYELVEGEPKDWDVGLGLKPQLSMTETDETYAYYSKGAYVLYLRASDGIPAQCKIKFSVITSTDDRLYYSRSFSFNP
ncbi:MAG: hypothetical protein HY762_05180 [Planctomycetes bacterium]|nr:hypothetical protein [Planctomycetota bacterium]